MTDLPVPGTPSSTAGSESLVVVTAYMPSRKAKAASGSLSAYTVIIPRTICSVTFAISNACSCDSI